jgi:hypothetical protein
MAAELVPRISIAVLNYLAVSPETLARVEREAGNILLSLGGLGAQLQESGSGAESTITVRVHNDAEVSAGTIRSALREAKRIFSDAGINTVWRECPPSTSRVAAESVCNQTLGPMLLEARILPRNNGTAGTNYLALPSPSKMGACRPRSSISAQGMQFKAEPPPWDNFSATFSHMKSATYSYCPLHTRLLVSCKAIGARKIWLRLQGDTSLSHAKRPS